MAKSKSTGGLIFGTSEYMVISNHPRVTKQCYFDSVVLQEIYMITIYTSTYHLDLVSEISLLYAR